MTLALALAWVVIAFFVFRFVVRTGGTTIGRVAHWFGGASVMLVIGLIMIGLYASFSPAFANRLNDYLLTHPLSKNNGGRAQVLIALPAASPKGGAGTIINLPLSTPAISVYHAGAINKQASINSNILTLDPLVNQDISWWGTLWQKQ